MCLNCPGTLESLSVNQIRRNETRLLSSEDTCLSAVTQANGGKRAFGAFWSTRGYMIVLRFASGIAHAGLFHYQVSQREDRGHTLELIQTSGAQEHKLLNEAAIWIETPNCFSWCTWRYSISKVWKTLHFLIFCNLCLLSLSCFEQLISLGYETVPESLCLRFCCASSTAMTQPGLTGEGMLRSFFFSNGMFLSV